MKNRSLFLLLSTAFLFAFQIAKGQSPALKSVTDKHSIIIGEPFQLTVASSFQHDIAKVNWFKMPDSIPHFVLLSKENISSDTSGSWMQYSQRFTLTSFDSGTFALPSFIIGFERKGKQLTLATDSIRINISYNPLDSVAPFHDIKPIMEVKEPEPVNYWYWIALADAILFIIILVLLIKRMLRRPVRKKELADPYKEATDGLNKLSAMVLSDIFKRYVGRVYNRKVSHFTTEEVLLYIKDKAGVSDLSGIAEALRLGDAVKFAKYLPGDNDNKTAFITIKKAIDNIHTLTSKDQ